MPRNAREKQIHLFLLQENSILDLQSPMRKPIIMIFSAKQIINILLFQIMRLNDIGIDLINKYCFSIQDQQKIYIQYKMKKNRGGPNFTHFGSIPFIREQHRRELSQVQSVITDVFASKNLHNNLKLNNPNLFHLTLSMLTLPHQSTRTKVQQVLQQKRQQLRQILQETRLTTDKIHYFTFKNRTATKNALKNVSVIYLDLKKDEYFNKLAKLTDQLIRILMKEQIITNQELRDMHIEYNHNINMFCNSDPHITLFRCENLSQTNDFLECFNQIQNIYEGRTLQCDYIDISTRFEYDKTKFYTPLYRIQLNQKGQKQNKSQKPEEKYKIGAKVEEKYNDLQ